MLYIVDSIKLYEIREGMGTNGGYERASRSDRIGSN